VSVYVCVTGGLCFALASQPELVRLKSPRQPATWQIPPEDLAYCYAGGVRPRYGRSGERSLTMSEVQPTEYTAIEGLGLIQSAKVAWHETTTATEWPRGVFLTECCNARSTTCLSLACVHDGNDRHDRCERCWKKVTNHTTTNETQTKKAYCHTHETIGEPGLEWPQTLCRLARTMRRPRACNWECENCWHIIVTATDHADDCKGQTIHNV